MAKAILESRFPEIEAELPAKLDGVAEAAANLVAADAKGKVQVDTGTLRDAIHVEKESVGEYSVVAGDHDAFYGHMVENGTTHSGAHPFLVPSLEENEAEILALAKAALELL